MIFGKYRNLDVISIQLVFAILIALGTLHREEHTGHDGEVVADTDVDNTADVHAELHGIVIIEVPFDIRQIGTQHRTIFDLRLGNGRTRHGQEHEDEYFHKSLFHDSGFWMGVIPQI